MPHDMNASAIPYPSGAGDLPHHVLGADADRRLFGWLSQLERQRGYSFVSIGQSGEAAFRMATPEMLGALLPPANSDARLLVDRDGGLQGERGQAARTALYLFERDAAVGLLRSG